MKQPTGYERKGEEHLVCRLKKSIYGLKQSPRCWNMVLDTHWIGQPAYTEKLLTKMGISDCKPVKTPVDPGNRLVKAAEDEEALDQPL